MLSTLKMAQRSQERNDELKKWRWRYTQRVKPGTWGFACILVVPEFQKISGEVGLDPSKFGWLCLNLSDELATKRILSSGNSTGMSCQRVLGP